MVPNPSSLSFYGHDKYRWQANIIKRVIAIAANGSYKLISVNGQDGRLGQVSVNLASQTAVRLVVDVDSARLVNHSPANVEETGTAGLALEIPNAFDSLLRTTKSSGSNRALTFMAHLIQLDFENRLEVNLVNDTTSAVNLNAAWAVWGILRRPK